MITPAIIVQPQQTHQSETLRTQCARYVQPLTPAMKRSDAARIGGATKMRTEPQNVHLVMASVGWRLVWATPDGGEEGVWFLKRTPQGGYRTAETWGGSFSSDADRADGVKWAVGRGVPQTLAQCFASIGVDHEMMR